MLRNWRKNAVRNLALCYGAIWRRREKPQYGCTTTVPQVHKSPRNIVENLFSVWLLVRINLFVPSRFWTTYTNFDKCCQRYIATCGKKLYGCTSTCTFTAITSNAVEFSSNLSAIYTNWCAHPFSPIFGLFAIFDRNFAKIVAPPGDGNGKPLMHLKEQYKLVRTWLLRKRWKECQNRPINCDAILIQKCPLERRACRPRSVTNRKTNVQTPCFRTYSRHALFDLPQTLHGDRGRRDHSKRFKLFLDPTHSFSYGVHGKNRANDRRAVSQQ